MPTNLRIFIEFAGYFLPILGDSGIYHVFPIPPNCSTINDVAYEIIKKYELTPLAPDGIDLKINNKYVLLPRDNIQNTIREGDELHISPRVIQSKWNNHKQTISKKRKSNSIEHTNTNTNTNTENNHNTDTLSTDINHTITHTPPPKKRKISNINSATSITTSVISTGTSASSSVTCYSSSDSDDNLNHNNINPLADIPEENNHNNTNINDTNDESSSSDDTEDSSSDSSEDSINKNNINNKQENNDTDIIMNNNNIMNAENINESINNINGNNNVSSTDSDSESDSMSSESDSEQDNEDKPQEQIQEQVQEQEQEQVDNKIENGDMVTLNDALKMVNNCKDKIINNNNESENGYLRSVKVNDRIKVCIDNEWKCGTVNGVFANSIIELILDEGNHNRNGNVIDVTLDEIEWDFEPENFAAPRLLKKINGRNYCNGIDDEIMDGESDGKIKRLIEESGNNNMGSDGLKCDGMIAYKILELVNWEPVQSEFKMGKIIEIKDDIVVIEYEGKRRDVLNKNLCEIYEINMEKVKQNELKLKKTKEKRDKRKQKQKETKVLGRRKSM